MIDVALLKQICETPGAPGFEHRIRSLVINQIKGLVDELSIDTMGNLVAVKKGKTPRKVMVAAHMDEISFIVTHIDEDGFLRFHTLGGFDPKTLTSQRVIVHGKEDIYGVLGCKPIHLMQRHEAGKPLPIQEYFIDIGMRKEEAEKIVSVGNPVTRDRDLVELGDCVTCKSIDNRVSVYILIEVLKRLKEEVIPYDFYAVFTVQEEVGLRGAMTAAHAINPDFGLGLDVTIAFDVPVAQPHEYVTKLGAGTAIKIMDGSTICDSRMVNYLKEVADRESIQWQPEILPAGGTDTAGLQRYGKNASIAGAISIPLRHIHQTIELANKSDIHQSILLLEAAVKQLADYSWSFDEPSMNNNDILSF